MSPRKVTAWTVVLFAVAGLIVLGRIGGCLSAADHPSLVGCIIGFVPVNGGQSVGADLEKVIEDTVVVWALWRAFVMIRRKPA
ncbi:MAG TPA: hypothetical protein VHZ55_10155 [Bryobacteraceae bacterium]|jgi:hypothetical protein|nr:hypothetical protein [Bryobacteraceae bacterium]